MIPQSSHIHADIATVAEACRSRLHLSDARLGEEYYYQSLPLCVIDAVFSISIRYETVRHVVQRYCDHFALRRLRLDRASLPPAHEQERLSDFCHKISEIGIERFATDIFQNRCRTSTKNGILKAEATFLFSRVMTDFDIQYFQDLPKIASNTSFEDRIEDIPGQGSGKSLRYFFMLAGNENFIKADRMILRFLVSVLNRQLAANQAEGLLVAVAEELKKEYTHITPRLLDHAIWNHQRD